MDVQTILWPTDLSQTSKKAAPKIIELAQKHGAKIVLLYVGVDLCSYFPAYGDYPKADLITDFQSWELEKAKDKMEDFCAKELSACPNLEMRMVTGDAAEEILKKIGEEKADLVVMATRGEGVEWAAKSGTTLAPIAEKIIARSPVPVMSINA